VPRSRFVVRCTGDEEIPERGLSAVIEVNALGKSYRRRRGGRVRALDGLDLSVSSGGVFGFLGPNGSGKTTTIRCLLGLARPDTGHCRVFGAESPTGLPDVIARVGALVEAPGINPGMSGRQTLTVLATTVGIGHRTVEATLERVGLAERADDLVRGYSLGMRQRLGIAVALLKDPELLVLDEPANGLDPAGIREVRELIGRLSGEGRTVFLSSHLLGEVEQVCTEVAIVSAGRTVAQGSVKDVLASTRPAAMWVKVGDLAAGAATLRRAGFGVGANGDRLRVGVATEKAELVTRALVADGHYPTELRPVEASLEDAFFALTEQPGEDGA
jgi:ABC-2 type transport system ATP-binding protein